mmetsp:Transcript_2060/g.5733  ORF Transcript_2060/g.5733 Transcript_2060/m.5733 type:complete len:168 (-) Transcript_2060:222-725(-)
MDSKSLKLSNCADAATVANLQQQTKQAAALTAQPSMSLLDKSSEALRQLLNLQPSSNVAFPSQRQISGQLLQHPSISSGQHPSQLPQHVQLAESRGFGAGERDSSTFSVVHFPATPHGHRGKLQQTKSQCFLLLLTRQRIDSLKDWWFHQRIRNQANNKYQLRRQMG